MQHGLFKGVSLAVDSLMVSAGTKGLLVGQVDAILLTTDLLRCV